MNTRSLIAWVGAAALAAALFFIAIRPSAEPPPAPATEQDLFPFLRFGGAAALESREVPALSATPAASPAPEAPMQFLEVEQAAARMRAEGASDDDLYRLRAAAMNPEHAARLAQMENQEAAWNARVQVYLAERARSPVGIGNASDATLQQLRDAHFSAEEQPRLAAYETASNTGVPRLILPAQ